jgi:carboxyl-terminal processing protease
LLSEAIAVSNLFLPEGKPIVGTRGRDSEKGRAIEAKKDREVFKPAAQRPVVVLVNDGSASASEIVASALQDNRRATILGERTYGKGSVQKLLRLQFGDEKAAVKLTTETYWRPNGENMDRRLAPKERPDEWGVKPDVEVPMTPLERGWALVEYGRGQWVAGKPSVVGPNPPTPPMPKVPGSVTLGLGSLISPNGTPSPNGANHTKLPVDKQLIRATEILRRQLSGVGEAPPPAPKVPLRIAG